MTDEQPDSDDLTPTPQQPAPPPGATPPPGAASPPGATPPPGAPPPGTAAPYAAATYAATPYAAPAPSPRRRFPWIPVLAVLAVLQLIASGVLLALLVGTGTQVVRLNDTVAERDDEIAELEDALDDVAAQRDQAREELASTEAGLDTALQYATVYEACLVPLFGAYDAWDAEEIERGDGLFEEAWGEEGPCWEAEAYLAE